MARPGWVASLGGSRARGNRLYYGWVIAGTLAATETISWGILFYAFSVFLVPMQAELGWSRGELTGAYSLALLISGLAALPVGRWLDRHGPRALMTAGSILGTGLLLAWAAVDTLSVFYLIWAVMGLAMAATLYEPAFAVIASWFERNRGRAMLLLTFFGGLASTIFLPVSAWLVERLGWREALVVLAIFLGATTIPAHALLLRRRPEDLGLRPDGMVDDHAVDASSPPAITGITLRAALHAAAFWWLAIAFSLGTLASVAIGVHLIPYLLEAGYGAEFAAFVTGLIGATQVATRVLVSLVGNRWSQVAVTAVVFVLQAVALLTLIWWNQPAGILIAVVLLGAGRGATTLTRAGLVAELYGRAHYGAIGGALALFLTGARTIAPVGAGVAYGWRDGYGPVLWGLAIASGLAAAAMIGVPGWRR